VPRPSISRRGVRITTLAVAVVAAAGFAGCDLNENADVDRGRQLFTANCGTCHTLAQAGTSATVGPNLDAAFAQARLDGMDNDTIEGVVQTQIANPRRADPEQTRIYMPADLVTGQDAEDVATYVASVAGVPGAKPPKLAPPELFADRCGSCHMLAAAATTGTTGPDLDEVLKGKPASYIEKQIVDPNSQIAKGYPPDVMPQDFGDSLTPEDLKALVQYLLESVGKGQSAKAGG
jgi:mono/diheme cytochrome c family protein